MKLYIVQGPQGSGKTKKINDIVGELDRKQIGYVDNFCNGSLKDFYGGPRIKIVVATLRNDLDTEIHNLMDLVADKMITVRFPYFKNEITIERPDIIIESQVPINLDDIYDLKVGFGCEFDLVDINLFNRTELFLNEFDAIRDWAEERGIYGKGDVKTQFLKLAEESGELAKAILKDDREEFEDAIGDCVVVLTNLAKLNGMNIEDCINSAYNVIAKRKGKMENGTFVKD